MAELPKMTEDQKNLIKKEEKRKAFMFTGLAGCRNGEINLRYYRGTIITLINLGAFSLLGTQLANPTPILYRILGIFGIASCAFWLAINKKAQYRIDYWHACLAKIEPPENELFVFRVFTGTDWKKLNKWPTFQTFFNLLPIMFFILWAGVIATSLGIEKKQPEEKTPVILFQFQFKTFNQSNTLKGGAP